MTRRDWLAGLVAGAWSGLLLVEGGPLGVGLPPPA